MSQRSASVAAAFALSACSGAPSAPPFVVHVRNAPETCVIIVGNRQVPTDEFRDLAKKEARKGRAASVIADTTVAYRCFGSVIFTLQQAGFEKVGFISEPPGPPEG